VNRYGNIDDTDEAPAGQHDEHGNIRFARASANPRDTVRKREQAIKQRFRSALSRSQGDNFFRPVSFDEQIDAIRGQNPNEDTDNFRHDYGAKNSELRPRFGAVEFFRAQILSDESRERHGKTGNRQEGKALYAGIASAGGHGVISESVDVRLHDDVCNRYDGILHTRRKPEAQNSAEHSLMKTDLPDGDLIHFLRPKKLRDAQNRAYGLRNRRCRRRRTHPHLEYADKQEVENDVEECGKNQIIQRMPAVAHRLQNTDGDVIQDDRGSAVKINAEIFYRVRQYVFGRTHPP